MQLLLNEKIGKTQTISVWIECHIDIKLQAVQSYNKQPITDIYRWILCAFSVFGKENKSDFIWKPTKVQIILGYTNKELYFITSACNHKPSFNKFIKLLKFFNSKERK